MDQGPYSRPHHARRVWIDRRDGSAWELEALKTADVRWSLVFRPAFGVAGSVEISQSIADGLARLSESELQELLDRTRRPA